jgi:putative transposase
LKLGKLLSPARRRAAVEEVQRALPEVSERRACRVLGQPRAVQRYTARVRDDEAPLTGRIVELASVYGRYGSPRITGMLRNEGWNVNHKRVERVWRQAGLKVPRRQPRRGRLWLNDGSCIRLRPERKDHVWAYDFVAARTHVTCPRSLVQHYKSRVVSIESTVFSLAAAERRGGAPSAAAASRAA